MRVLVWAMSAAISLVSASAVSAQAVITGAILPTARSVDVGEPATFFVTMVNSGNQDAINCGPWIDSLLATDLSFRDFPLDDQLQLAGDENTSINLDAGETQNILFEVTASAPLSRTIPLIMGCNGARADYSSAVHDISFTAINDGVAADIIAVGLTVSGDGIIQIPGPGRVGIMTVAATNIAGPGEESAAPANIRVQPSAGRFTGEFELTVCELNSSSICITPRSPFLDIQFAPGEDRFFGVFVRSPATSGIPLLPGFFRIELTFRDTPAPAEQSYLRARTSAAVTSPAPATVNTSTAGIYEFQMTNDGAISSYSPGWLYIDTDGSVIGSIATSQGNWQDNIIILDNPIPAIGEDGRARIRTPMRYGRTNVSGHGADAILVIDPAQRIHGVFGLPSASSEISAPQFVIPGNDGDFIGAPHLSHYAADTVLTVADLAGSYSIIDERSGETVGSMNVFGSIANVQTTILGAGPFGARGTEVCRFSLVLAPAEQGRMADITGGQFDQCNSLRLNAPLSGRMAWRPTGDGSQSGYHFIIQEPGGAFPQGNAYGFFAIPN